MAALCAAPWYFQAAFCVFGGLLLACATYSLCCVVGDWLHRYELRRERELLDPNDFGAQETRVPKE